MAVSITSRELRNRWGTYLESVRQGATIEVTVRGEPVAELRPLTAAGDKPLYEKFLASRDHQDWGELYRLYEKMPKEQARSVRVCRQYAFALNRDGRGEEAEKALLELLEEEGPSAETCGILGRVYKDRWYAARKAGRKKEAAHLLDLAVRTYLDGHDADPSNPYPGINALTLMKFHSTPPQRYDSLLREVSEAVDARTEAGQTSYWHHATRIELAFHTGVDADVAGALAGAMAAEKGVWMMSSTLGNLKLLCEARQERGEPAPPWWIFVEASFEGARSQTEIEVDPQDLEKIEGIGPKIAAVLRSEAILTFTHLAEAEVDRLRRILREAGPEFGWHDPETWPEQAALAAAGRWRELEELQDELWGGRRRS